MVAKFGTSEFSTSYMPFVFCVVYFMTLFGTQTVYIEWWDAELERIWKEVVMA
jgi:hypothetical protein